MKIAFIVAEKEPQGCPSLGVAYLASYLKKYLKLNNIKIFSHIPKDFNILKKFSPDIVGISAVSPQMNIAIKLSQRIKKELNALVVIGGAHISSLPKSLPETCDIGVIGEGEQTLLELVSLLRKLKIFCMPQLYYKDICFKIHNIKGIVFRKGGKIVITETREQIKPLDKIPYPSRDLLDMKHFLQTGNTFGPHFGRGAHIFTSRGCPYKCIFCAPAVFWGGPRVHSAKYVVGEIKTLIKTYDVKLIHIYDDLFIFNKKRVAKIANLIHKEGIHKKVKFGIFGRVDLLDEEVCKYLKKMNVVHILFGAESGNQRILNFLKNRKVTIQQTKNAIKLAKKYGFTVDAGFIIGSPDETEQEMMETFRFIKSLKLNKFGHYIATPYPGTGLWEIAKKQGVVSDEMDWSKLWLSRRYFKNPKDQIIINTTMSKSRLFEIWNIFERERKKLFNYKWQKKFQ